MLGTKVVDKICIVPGCSSVGGRLYRLPKNNLRWLEWKRACPFFHDIDKRLLSHARICQVHFEAECFGESNELKLGAVPTLQLPNRPQEMGNISVISSSNTVIATGRWSSTDKGQYQCVLCGLSQSSVEDSNEKVILSRFPLDVPTCREWVKYVGLKYLAKMSVTELNSKVFLCQNHFKPDPSGKRVPSINLPNHVLDDSLLTKFGLDTEKVEPGVNAVEAKEELLMNSKCVLCRRSSNQGAILSKFPLDPKTCRLWVKNIGIDILSKVPFEHLNDNFYLCENHFKPDCIRDGVLLEKSIPTVNLPFPPLANNLIRTNIGMAPKPEDVADDFDELNTTKIKTETDDRSPLAYRSDKADEVLTLFLSYAGTFRKLHRKFQAMLKLDLAKIFSRYEMKNAAYLEERKKLEEAERGKKFRNYCRTPLAASNNMRQKLNRAIASAPVRIAPQVSAPVRIAPQVSAPVRIVPHVSAPVRIASHVSAPVRIAPEVSAPVRITPDVSAPVRIAPDVSAPVRIAPEVSAPVKIAPEVSAPVRIAPEVSAPVRIAPEVSAPVGIAPEVSTSVRIARDLFEPIQIDPLPPRNETADSSFSYQPLHKKANSMTIPVPNKAVESTKNYSRVKKKAPAIMPKPVNIAPRPEKFEIVFKPIIYTQHNLVTGKIDQSSTAGYADGTLNNSQQIFVTTVNNDNQIIPVNLESNAMEVSEVVPQILKANEDEDHIGSKGDAAQETADFKTGHVAPSTSDDTMEGINISGVS